MVALFKSVNRASCPKCSKTTSLQHCSRKKCPWFQCYSCVDEKQVVVFDKFHKYFIGEWQ